MSQCHAISVCIKSFRSTSQCLRDSAQGMRTLNVLRVICCLICNLSYVPFLPPLPPQGPPLGCLARRRVHALWQPIVLGPRVSLHQAHALFPQTCSRWNAHIKRLYWHCDTCSMRRRHVRTDHGCCVMCFLLCLELSEFAHNVSRHAYIDCTHMTHKTFPLMHLLYFSSSFTAFSTEARSIRTPPRLTVMLARPVQLVYARASCAKSIGCCEICREVITLLHCSNLIRTRAKNWLRYDLLRSLTVLWPYIQINAYANLVIQIATASSDGAATARNPIQSAAMRL